MKKVVKVQKIRLSVFILSLMLGTVFFSQMPMQAFEWPQEIASLNEIIFFFGEDRKDFISSSLVFPKGEVIKLSEAGKVLFQYEAEQSCSRFPSSLGNALVLAHENDLRSLYANLGEIAVEKDADFLQKGLEIAMSGDSGWHEDGAGLEFAVIDVKNKALVNPLLVFPMGHKAIDFAIGKIYIKDVKGDYRELGTGKSFEEGFYTFYREARDTMPIFRSLVSLNGKTIDSLSYDSLSLWKEKLVLKSNQAVLLDYKQLYPMENRQYLCEVKLSRGKNTVLVQVFDIFGNKKQVSYTIDVY